MFNAVLKNEDALLPEHLPKLLPHREDKIKQIANNLLPASKGRKPQNTFLFGPPGIGKTVTTKFVFREFEDYSGINTFYINCWDYKSAHSILSKIAVELGAFVQRRGMGKDEIIERLVECCKKMKKGLVVCLDEVDQLVFNEEEALYDLARINQYIDNPFGLVLISNDPYVFVDIDPRIKSSLNLEEVEFKAYSLDEMMDILEKRAKLAFLSVEDGVILLSANHAVQHGGDVRIGLECLIKAGRVAERNNSRKLKVDHVKEILPTIKPAKPQILRGRASEDEKIILEILDEKRKLFSGELYREYCKRSESPVSERAFRNFVNHLGEINLVKIWKRERGIKGRTRVISRA